jgi:nitrogen fixation/metabolism regulation signal transduction histidine kinase
MIGVAVVLLVFVALMIPIVAILVDSPLGRSIARRLEGGSTGTGEVGELHRKVELLEGEVEELHRSVSGMKDELQFVQRLLEKPKPPGSSGS